MAREDNAIDACDAPLLELQIQISAMWYDRKKLRAENKQLREALKKYGHHSILEICCEASIKEGGKCNCGFEQALKA